MPPESVESNDEFEARLVREYIDRANAARDAFIAAGPPHADRNIESEGMTMSQGVTRCNICGRPMFMYRRDDLPPLCSLIILGEGTQPGPIKCERCDVAGPNDAFVRI